MILASLFIILSIFLLDVYWNGQQDQQEAFSASEITENEIKDELIIAVFIVSIRKHVQDF